MLDLEEVAFIASLLLQQCHCASSMSELGDFDDADSIDWDEAIETLTAVETARATQKTAASSSTDPQSTSTASIRANTATASPPLPLPTDEEILFLYDLIDTSQYILVNDDGEDIEDIAAGMKRGLKPVARTLFDQFRKKRGFLSVTDLTAPSGWCEVQFAYSLLGRRDLKLENRPEKIVTPAGNEIKINKTIAIRHDKVLEKGKQVHAVLEREVHPEQILVRTDTKADRWGLRLLNQIVSLVTLRDAGKAREIPVFGFFDDDFVMGVMDEVEKRPLPTPEVVKVSKNEEASQNGVKITDFFKSKSPVVVKPTHGFYLVDSKTRGAPVLPKPEYTVASRYQLMLYRYLFNKHATDSLDWPRFWKHVKLSPEDTLSPSFLEQTKVICLGSNLEDMLHLTTIGQLSEYLRATHLEIGELQEGLELVYRWRGSSYSSPRRSKRRQSNEGIGRGSAGVVTSSDSSDAQLQSAIAASLKETAGTAEKPISIDEDEHVQSKTAPDDSGMFVDQPLTKGSPEQGPTENGGTTQSSSPKAIAAQSPQTKSTPGSPQVPSSTPIDIWDIANKAEVVSKQVEGSIIGTTKFQYKEDEMVTYVRNTLSFWKGREPKGVSLSETNKCRTCEYQDGCEWLTMKAEEHLVRAREKRALQEANTKTRIVL